MNCIEHAKKTMKLISESDGDFLIWLIINNLSFFYLYNYKYI